MNIFVDTSGILAILDNNEPNHPTADKIWQRLLDETDQFITTNYIIAEASAVIQRRLGMAATRVFLQQMTPVFQISWIDADLHHQAIQGFVMINRRQLSLVDCVSFAVMRKQNITSALAFDPHFEEQGFTCLR
jgi:predicted nucleic acid-binding protein